MSTHVLIAGGGIAGCMTAMALVARGCRVTIVERNRIASQTSGESSWAGGGIIFPLLPWMYNQHVNALSRDSAQRYPELCQRLQQDTGIDPGYDRSGFLILPGFDAEAALQWCRANDMAAQPVRAAAFGVSSPGGEEALWLPQVGQVRPPHFMQALRHWLEAHQVTLLEQTQLKPLQAQEDMTAWETEDGRRLQADRFVVTSGAWSFELLKDIAQKLDIKPMRGQILLYRPQRNIEQIVYREGFYLIPRRDGHLLAGSTLEDVGFDSSVTEAVRGELQAKAEALLPELARSPVIKHWSGLRPGTPDNMPTISAHPRIPNLFLNTGHFRYGLTMAPASADMVAAMVCGETPALDATPYRLAD